MSLELRSLCVTYPGVRGAPDKVAVDSVSMELAPGDIGVLIGPSGCGKTSLLRAVAGLEPVSGGSIAVGGKTVSRPGFTIEPEQRRIGMVFQDYALFPHLDVDHNVAFGIEGLRKPERRERVAEVLELVGMGDLGSRMPYRLSGGQQQRVALARALAPRPQLLLLDEPFSNLDVDLRDRLAHEVRAILKAAHATALLVTHDQLEAFAIGDVIGVMHEGKLHQCADAYTLYHRPATRFVADFIGHGVFTKAHLELRQVNGSTRKRLMTALGEMADLSPEQLDGLPMGELELLLRADDIVHDDGAPIQAEIVRKAFRGSEFLYTLRLASGEMLMAHVPSHHNHQVGEWIGVRTEMAHVVAFAPGSAP